MDFGESGLGYYIPCVMACPCNFSRPSPDKYAIKNIMATHSHGMPETGFQAISNETVEVCDVSDPLSRDFKEGQIAHNLNLGKKL